MRQVGQLGQAVVVQGQGGEGGARQVAVGAAQGRQAVAVQEKALKEKEQNLSCEMCVWIILLRFKSGGRP